MQFSILDLAVVAEGSDARQAIANSVALARAAEGWGYHRFWLAEHHNMPGIASAATAVLIDHVAGNTKTIRVGAGGVMLPNHAPLAIAEQFLATGWRVYCLARSEAAVTPLTKSPDAAEELGAICDAHLVQ